MLLQEAGVFGELARQSRYYSFWTLLKPLENVLYLVASVLAWICTRKTGTAFFKWLAIAFTITSCLWLEGLLFSYLAPNPLASHGADLMDLVKQQVQINQLHSLFLQLPGAVLSATFLVYAVFLWGEQVRFVEVFKPIWILLLFFLFTVGIAINFAAMTRVDSTNYLLLINFGHILTGSLVPAIYVFGIIAIRRKPLGNGHWFLKWLAAYFIMGVLAYALTYLISLLSFAVHLQWLTWGVLYTSQLLSWAMPALIVFGLANYLVAAKSN